jgi:hypothetical protein
MPEPSSFPVFATITLGRLKKGYPYLEALRHMNALFANSAEEVLAKAKCSETRQDVDLVIVTPADAGVNVYDCIDRFFTAALERGLVLCPAEVGPALLIAQKPDAWLDIAMEPIENLAGVPERFGVGPMWGKKGISVNADRFTKPDTRWVFVQPRRTP